MRCCTFSNGLTQEIKTRQLHDFQQGLPAKRLGPIFPASITLLLPLVESLSIYQLYFSLIHFNCASGAKGRHNLTPYGWSGLDHWHVRTFPKLEFQSQIREASYSASLPRKESLGFGLGYSQSLSSSSLCLYAKRVIVPRLPILLISPTHVYFQL